LKFQGFDGHQLNWIPYTETSNPAPFPGRYIMAAPEANKGYEPDAKMLEIGCFIEGMWDTGFVCRRMVETAKKTFSTFTVLSSKTSI